MTAVFKREFKAYFCSPIAYVLIGAFMFFGAILFVISNLFVGDGNFLTILGNLSLVIMIIVPILTMRTMSDDKKNGTEVMLMTSPTSTAAIVIEKYLAALSVFLIMVAGSMIFPVITYIFGNPAIAPIIGGYIGFIFLGASYIAIGVFCSSLTESQVVAAVLSFVFLIFIWLVDSLASLLGGPAGTVMSWFSLLSRFQPFYMGLLNLAPIVYYLSFIAVFLFMTIALTDKRR